MNTNRGIRAFDTPMYHTTSYHYPYLPLASSRRPSPRITTHHRSRSTLRRHVDLRFTPHAVYHTAPSGHSPDTYTTVIPHPRHRIPCLITYIMRHGLCTSCITTNCYVSLGLPSVTTLSPSIVPRAADMIESIRDMLASSCVVSVVVAITA